MKTQTYLVSALLSVAATSALAESQADRINDAHVDHATQGAYQLIDGAYTGDYRTIQGEREYVGDAVADTDLVPAQSHDYRYVKGERVGHSHLDS